MPSILRVEAPQRYRLTVWMSSAPSTSPAVYTITRTGSTASPANVSTAWIRPGEATVIELALDAPLVENVDYTLAIAGAGSQGFQLRRPVAVASNRVVTGEDPEAEVYGIDVSWITTSVGPDGDALRRRGLACLRYDLAAVALTEPGELAIDSDVGGGMLSRESGPGTTEHLGETSAALKRTWSKDERIVRGGVRVQASADGTGAVAVRAQIKTTGLDEEIPLSVSAR